MKRVDSKDVYQLVRNGDVAKLEALLTGDVSFFESPEGHLATYMVRLASMHNQPAIVEMLIKIAPANIEHGRRGQEITTALHEAAQIGNLQIVNLLIDRFPGLLQVRSSHNETVLEVVANSGKGENLEVFKAIIAKAPELLGVIGTSEMSMIHHTLDKPEMLQIVVAHCPQLLQHKAWGDSRGFDAIISASQYTDMSAVLPLLPGYKGLLPQAPGGPAMFGEQEVKEEVKEEAPDVKPGAVVDIKDFIAKLRELDMSPVEIMPLVETQFPALSDTIEMLGDISPAEILENFMS